MSSKNWILVMVLAVLAIGIGGVVSTSLFHDAAVSEVLPVDGAQATAFDPKQGTYTIEGTTVTLKDGVSAVTTADGGGEVVTTKYFGNELVIDLNNDGREDTVFLLTQEGGGSGVFFYLAALLNTETGVRGSRAILLGDRIAPQNIARGQNQSVVVNYAERGLDEPMTAAPSLGVSKRFIFDAENNQFSDVVEDFEGEADPLLMSLSMKTWVWRETNLNDGSVVTPAKPEAFSLTFADDGSFSATTDCNGVGGQYVTDGPALTFSDMMSTLMYCEGSQETDFVGYLSNTSGYHFTTKGELILDLKFDSGAVVLK
jgi:heat shock protein HslJ